MNISVDVDTVSTDRFLSQLPEEMRDSIEEFRNRVGYKLERESKHEAPHVTGNLKRMTVYFESGANAGKLISHARYAKYVHGPPFYKNKIRRRETPFITSAISNSETFIKTESEKVLRRVLP